MQTLEGKLNGVQLHYQPSQLAILLGRICHPIRDNSYVWNFSEEQSKDQGLRKLSLKPIPYFDEAFSYEISIPNQKDNLSQFLENPIQERIFIKGSDKSYKVLIDRNPKIRSKWKNNTRVRVSKVYEDGKIENSKVFSIYDLNNIERYARSLY